MCSGKREMMRGSLVWVLDLMCAAGRDFCGDGRISLKNVNAGG